MQTDSKHNLRELILYKPVASNFNAIKENTEIISFSIILLLVLVLFFKLLPINPMGLFSFAESKVAIDPAWY